MIREFFRRRAIRRAFSRYVSPDVVQSLFSDRVQAESATLHSGEIGFVLSWVNGYSPEQVSERTGRVADLAIEYGGVVDSMVSGLVIVSFGASPPPFVHSSDQAGFVAALIQELGNEIKLVHGCSKGYYGNIGSARRMAYSFIIEDFGLALKRLCSLDFGQAEEFMPPYRE